MIKAPIFRIKNMVDRYLLGMRKHYRGIDS